MTNIKRYAYILYLSQNYTPRYRIVHLDNEFEYQTYSSSWTSTAPPSTLLENRLNNLKEIQDTMRSLDFSVQTPKKIDNTKTSGIIHSYTILQHITNEVSTMKHGDFAWIHYIGNTIVKSDPLSGNDIPCLEMVYGEDYLSGSVSAYKTYGLPSTELLKIAKVAAPGVKVLFTIDANDSKGISELPFGDVNRHNPDTLILSDVWSVSGQKTETDNDTLFTQTLIQTINNSHHQKSITEWIEQIKSTIPNSYLSYAQSGAAHKSVFSSTTTDNFASIAQSPIHRCAISSKPQRKIRVVVRLDNINILNKNISDPTPYRLHSIDIKLRILHTNARRLHIDPKAPIEYESCLRSSKLYRRNYTIEENTECAYTIRIKLEGTNENSVVKNTDVLAKYESYLYRLDEHIELSLWATVTNTKLPKSCANIYCSIESMQVIHHSNINDQIHTVASSSNVYGVCEVYTEATDTTWKERVQQSNSPNASISWISHPSNTTKTSYHIVTVGMCMKYFKRYTIQNPMLVLSTIGGYTHLSETVPTNNYAHAHYIGPSDFAHTVTNKDTIVPIAYFKIDERLSNVEYERWSGLHVQLTSMNVVPNFENIPSKDKMDTTLYLAMLTNYQNTSTIDDYTYTPAPNIWKFGHSEITSYSTYQTDTNHAKYVIDQRPTIYSTTPSSLAYSTTVPIDESTPIYFTLTHKNVIVSETVRTSQPYSLNANVVDWISPTCFRLNKTPLMSVNAQLASYNSDIHYTLTLHHTASPSDFEYLTNTHVLHTECCLFSINSENIHDDASVKTINRSYILTPDGTSSLTNYLSSNTFDTLHSTDHLINQTVSISKNSVNGAYNGFTLNNTALIYCLPSWKTLQYDTVLENTGKELFEFSIVMLWKFDTIPSNTTRLFGSDNLLCIECDVSTDPNTTKIKIGSTDSVSKTTINYSDSDYYIAGCNVKSIPKTLTDVYFDCALYISEYASDGTSTGGTLVIEDRLRVDKSSLDDWLSVPSSNPAKDYRKILAINMPNNTLDDPTLLSEISIGMCSVYDKVINVKKRMEEAKSDWTPPST